MKTYLYGIRLQWVVLLRGFDFEGEKVEGQALSIDFLDDKQLSGGRVDRKEPLIIA